MKFIFFLFSLSMGINLQFSESKILKTILQEKKIVSYLHPELSDRKVLYLAQNDYFELNEKVGELVVKTINKDLAKKKKNRLKLTSVKIKDSIKVLTFDYPIEGATFIVKMNKQDRILNIEVLEK